MPRLSTLGLALACLVLAHGAPASVATDPTADVSIQVQGLAYNVTGYDGSAPLVNAAILELHASACNAGDVEVVVEASTLVKDDFGNRLSAVTDVDLKPNACTTVDFQFPGDAAVGTLHARAELFLGNTSIYDPDLGNDVNQRDVWIVAPLPVGYVL